MNAHFNWKPLHNLAGNDCNILYEMDTVLMRVTIKLIHPRRMLSSNYNRFHYRIN